MKPVFVCNKLIGSVQNVYTSVLCTNKLQFPS